MTDTYQVTGMICGGREAKVKTSLLMLRDVTGVEVSKETNTATLTMDKYIPLSELQKAIAGAGSQYQITAT